MITAISISAKMSSRSQRALSICDDNDYYYYYYHHYFNNYHYFNNDTLKKQSKAYSSQGSYSATDYQMAVQADKLISIFPLEKIKFTKHKRLMKVDLKTNLS